MSYKKTIHRVLESDAYTYRYYTPSVAGATGGFSSVTYVNRDGFAILGAFGKIFHCGRVVWSAATGGSGVAVIVYNDLLASFDKESLTHVTASGSTLIVYSNVSVPTGKLFGSPNFQTVNLNTSNPSSPVFNSLDISSFNSGSFNKSIIFQTHHLVNGYL